MYTISYLRGDAAPPRLRSSWALKLFYTGQDNANGHYPANQYATKGQARAHRYSQIARRPIQDLVHFSVPNISTHSGPCQSTVTFKADETNKVTGRAPMGQTTMLTLVIYRPLEVSPLDPLSSHHATHYHQRVLPLQCALPCMDA